MRAFDHIYVHPTFSPEPASEAQSTTDKWHVALLGTAVTVAVASGVSMAVGVPSILTACVPSITCTLPATLLIACACDSPASRGAEDGVG